MSKPVGIAIGIPIGAGLILLVFFLLRPVGTTTAQDTPETRHVSRPAVVMTEFGPDLSPQEKARIDALDTDELVTLLKEGCMQRSLEAALVLCQPLIDGLFRVSLPMG